MAFTTFNPIYKSMNQANVYSSYNFQWIKTSEVNGNRQTVTIDDSPGTQDQLRSARLFFKFIGVRTVLENGENRGLVNLEYLKIEQVRSSVFYTIGNIIQARQTGYQTSNGITFQGVNGGKYYYLSVNSAPTLGGSYSLYNDGSQGGFPPLFPNYKPLAPFPLAIPPVVNLPLSAFAAAPGRADTIAARSDHDAASYSNASNGIIVDLPNRLSWDGLYNDYLWNFKNAIGSRYNDILFGDEKDNIFESIAGSDTIFGGSGSDTVSFTMSESSVVVNLAGQITWNGADNSFLSSIENIAGSTRSDNLWGDAGDNIIDGHGGSDTILGGDGRDTVSFATTDKSVIIDLAAQLTWDGTSNSYLSSIENAIGSSASDTIIGNALDNILDGFAGSDFINGGDGNDTVSFAHAYRGVSVNLSSQTASDGTSNTKLQSIENAIGSPYGDNFYAGFGYNTFEGNGGPDNFIGNVGITTVSFARSASPVVIDMARNLIWDGQYNSTINAVENMIGSKGDDVLIGDNADNVIDGFGGADTIQGFAGVDTVSFNSSSRGVIIDLGGQASYDYLNNITLQGIENAIGSKYNDIIQPTDARNASISGGLTGNGGSDTFFFNQSGYSHQNITDFVAGNGADHDVIQYTSGIFAYDNPLYSAVEFTGGSYQSPTSNQYTDYPGGVLLSGSKLGDEILLFGVRLADLTEANFKLV